jgi:hypothetical protein
VLFNLFHLCTSLFPRTAAITTTTTTKHADENEERKTAKERSSLNKHLTKKIHFKDISRVCAKVSSQGGGGCVFPPSAFFFSVSYHISPQRFMRRLRYETQRVETNHSPEKLTAAKNEIKKEERKEGIKTKSSGRCSHSCF